MNGIFSFSHSKDKKTGVLLNGDSSREKAKEHSRQPAVVIHDLKNTLTAVTLRIDRLGADPGSVDLKDILNDMEQIACEMRAALDRLAAMLARQSHAAPKSRRPDGGKRVTTS